MSANFLLKVADVLEKTAAYVDAHESDKTAAQRKSREEALKVVSGKYAEATGEDLPEDVLSKLASSDEEVLSTVQKMVEKASGVVESLGRSSDKQGSYKPATKAESLSAAWDRFGSFIVS